MIFSAIVPTPIATTTCEEEGQEEWCDADHCAGMG